MAQVNDYETDGLPTHVVGLLEALAEEFPGAILDWQKWEYTEGYRVGIVSDRFTDLDMFERGDLVRPVRERVVPPEHRFSVSIEKFSPEEFEDMQNGDASVTGGGSASEEEDE